MMLICLELLGMYNFSPPPDNLIQQAMDKIDYQIAENFCEEALIELEGIHPSVWLETHKGLYESIEIKPAGLPPIANQNFEDITYHYIGIFFETYQKKSFEEAILTDRTQYEAIVYFFERMNISKIDELLDYHEYSDKEKTVFISLLDEVFDKFKNTGNERLYSRKGICKGCNYGCKGFSFIGGNDDSHIELVMEESDDRVKDIYHCNIFSYSEGKPPTGPRIQLYDDDELPF
jgi:hypothetical protein